MFKVLSLAISLLAIFPTVLATTSAGPRRTITLPSDNPLIYYHGRWDSSPGTWWTGSGFKLRVKSLTSLSLILGSHTTAPHATIGVSLDYAPFFNVNVSSGSNEIFVPSNIDPSLKGRASVVRINVEGWQNNRIHLEGVVVNSEARIVPYKPQKLRFQFIGDSLSAGQFLPQGINQAWPFLVGEAFKAEHAINAQPGAALADVVSYGNQHGVSYQFFRTEDTGYYYTTDHNYTTPWNFNKNRRSPTHIVIAIGANDASQNVTPEDFVQVYLDFIARLRKLYPKQPIFVFTPWGWPGADGSFGYYYTGRYEEIVNARISSRDKNVFLVNTTGWITWADVYPENQHPNLSGHASVTKKFKEWLEDWGLEKEEKWENSV